MEAQFETKIEAEGALEEARGESLGACPFFKDDCRDLAYKKAYRMKVCVCYYEGDIHQSNPVTQGKYWFVHYPYCTNVLINGVITVEN